MLPALWFLDRSPDLSESLFPPPNLGDMTLAESDVNSPVVRVSWPQLLAFVGGGEPRGAALCVFNSIPGLYPLDATK